VAFALTLLCPGCDRSRSREISVLLISVDTLRADRLNCYGYAGRELSPNIDALARDGILFENHVSASPWTTPAHMSLMTGLQPSTHGVIGSFEELVLNMERGGKFQRLPEARLTLAEALAAEGYATAAFTGGVTLDPRIGFDQGFEHYSSDMYKLDRRNMTALETWIDRHGGDPFFLFWHTFEVHAPYLSTEFLSGEFAALKEELREIAPDLATIESTQTHLSHQQTLTGLLARHDAYRPDVCEALYCGGVLSFDQRLGELLEDLRTRGLYDRMLIVLTSDHGDEFADHLPDAFYDSHGHTAYEEIIRSPLIVKLPRQDFAGTRVSAVTRTIDIMPTILELTGGGGPAGEVQGESLSPLWLAPGQALPRTAYSEAGARAYEVKSIRDGRYKYVVWMTPETVRANGRNYIPPIPTLRQLFDLQADPLERRNLLDLRGARAWTDLAASFERRLRAYVDEAEGEADEVELGAEAVRRLKALGYVD
jgi:arylsulfatase A-like enzyme